MALSQTIGFAFRRKYNLPPLSPFYLDMTQDEMLVDIMAHAHADDPKLRDVLVTDDYEAELEAMERASAKVPAEDWETLADDRF